MMSYKIKDNRQNNVTAKIEVTNEDKVKVQFNEPWIKMFNVKYSRTKIICSPRLCHVMFDSKKNYNMILNICIHNFILYEWIVLNCMSLSTSYQNSI
jgi:hypothetical protein